MLTICALVLRDSAINCNIISFGKGQTAAGSINLAISYLSEVNDLESNNNLTRYEIDI